MNEFKYRETLILKSELDFTRLHGSNDFHGEATLSTSVGISKDLEKNRAVRCIAELEIGGEEKAIRIYIKTASVFDIQVLENTETLRQDANAICLQRTLDELSQKLAELTRLHIGKEIKILMPQV